MRWPSSRSVLVAISKIRNPWPGAASWTRQTDEIPEEEWQRRKGGCAAMRLESYYWVIHTSESLRTPRGRSKTKTGISRARWEIGKVWERCWGCVWQIKKRKGAKGTKKTFGWSGKSEQEEGDRVRADLWLARTWVGRKVTEYLNSEFLCGHTFPFLEGWWPSTVVWWAQLLECFKIVVIIYISSPKLRIRTSFLLACPHQIYFLKRQKKR